MAEPVEKPPQQTEVFAAMGHCLSVYQQIESILREILRARLIEIVGTDWQAAVQKRQSEYGTSTLGSLVGAFVDDVLLVKKSSIVDSLRWVTFFPWLDG